MSSDSSAHAYSTLMLSLSFSGISVFAVLFDLVAKCRSLSFGRLLKTSLSMIKTTAVIVDTTAKIVVPIATYVLSFNL